MEFSFSFIVVTLSTKIECEIQDMVFFVSQLQRGYESKEQAEKALHAHNISVREILCDRLAQSCLEGRSSDAPMIAIKTALCCALSKMWDIEVRGGQGSHFSV